MDQYYGIIPTVKQRRRKNGDLKRAGEKQNCTPFSSGRQKRVPHPMQKMLWGCTHSNNLAS